MFGSKVCKLKNLYMASDDHLESGFGDLQSLLKGQGYSQGQSDHTVLTKYSNRGNIVTTLIVCG